MYDLTASIVTYRTEAAVLQKAMDSFLSARLRIKLFIVDNSASAEIGEICTDPRVVYIANKHNLGFGAGHNIALHDSIHDSKYHLILNPDVYFPAGTLEELFNYMQHNQDIGVVMPKVLYPDGSVQYLCKLLPTPFDLIARRFIPSRFHSIFGDRFLKYEMRDKNYDQIMDVPCLSGCFMFTRTEVLQSVGLFDERYFLYLEDVDYCRRIGSVSRLVYYPQVTIFHDYEKGSYKNYRLLWLHVNSAVKYFSKWGWSPFFS